MYLVSEVFICVLMDLDTRGWTSSTPRYIPVNHSQYRDVTSWPKIFSHSVYLGSYTCGTLYCILYPLYCTFHSATSWADLHQTCNSAISPHNVLATPWLGEFIHFISAQNIIVIILYSLNELFCMFADCVTWGQTLMWELCFGKSYEHTL